ncbi:hypothetical protein KI387_006835 [Taxus chinensis]|uniref:Kinesin motor domain-containing protein n=1 Tax=Taxus chinensis TaxID=29808 RepID=A0AA38GQU1_TAXCH|nr:hypothetical protein KI387_006835 [Taxus chinensis]
MNIQSHTFREEDSKKTDQVPELIVGEEDCNQKSRKKFTEMFFTLTAIRMLFLEIIHAIPSEITYAVEGQVNELRDLQDKHVREKKLWVSQVYLLSEKFKILKSECAKVSEEANSYASSFADISRMTSVVQALGNIRVFCRCRPLNVEEVAEGVVSIADFEAAKDDTAHVVVSVLDGYNV